MNSALRQENKWMGKVFNSLSAGAVASLITQPFQVLKTNMINTPSLYTRDLHRFIVRNGWGQYMRGAQFLMLFRPLAVLRQSYGFAIYTQVIHHLNTNLEDHFPNLNKYYRYSIAALAGKLTAMLFEAPLTLLKTRLEVISSTTFRQQLERLASSPRSHLTKGLRVTLLREAAFSLTHYNTYRYLKDDLLKESLGLYSAFIPAFFSGILAITISQPFEVVRSKISLSNQRITGWECLQQLVRASGWRGLIVGYLPRLIRKPINSGISWAIIDSIQTSTL